MGRGTGRKRRLAMLESLEKSDPKRHQELLDLRHNNPQAYRKAMRALGKVKGVALPIGGRGAVPRPHPGRETDPALSKEPGKKERE